MKTEELRKEGKEKGIIPDDELQQESKSGVTNQENTNLSPNKPPELNVEKAMTSSESILIQENSTEALLAKIAKLEEENS